MHVCMYVYGLINMYNYLKRKMGIDIEVHLFEFFYFLLTKCRTETFNFAFLQFDIVTKIMLLLNFIIFIFNSISAWRIKLVGLRLIIRKESSVMEAFKFES